MQVADSSQPHVEETRKRKRGEVRDDGMVFWSTAKGRELWLTPDSFASQQEKARQRYLKNAESIKAKLRQKYRENPEAFIQKAKEYAEKNAEKVREKARKYAEKNRDKKAVYLKKWYEENKARVFEKQKEYAKKNPHVVRKSRVNWMSKNREKHNKWRRENAKHRRRTDPIFALREIAKKRVRHAVENKGMSRGLYRTNKIASMVGCTWEELKAHLEKQFTEGMTWENRGEWEVDHIIPISSAQTEAEIEKLSHYSNLQPLWREENRRKSAKMPPQSDF